MVVCVLVCRFSEDCSQHSRVSAELGEDAECAEVRDALNFALLQLQRYFRLLRSRTQQQQQQQQQEQGDSILTQPLRGLSPMTPFRDAPDRFVWRWVDVDATKDGSSIRTPRTLPARLDKEDFPLPAVIQAAHSSDNNALVQLIERGNFYISHLIYFQTNARDASWLSILQSINIYTFAVKFFSGNLIAVILLPFYANEKQIIILVIFYPLRLRRQSEIVSGAHTGLVSPHDAKHRRFLNRVYLFMQCITNNSTEQKAM